MCLFIFHCSTPAKLNGHAQLDVPGLSQNEIQGLLLGSHQSQQAINVKREPEDLRIDPKCPRSQKVSKNELFSVFFFLYRFVCYSLPLPVAVQRKLCTFCTTKHCQEYFFESSRAKRNFSLRICLSGGFVLCQFSLTSSLLWALSLSRLFNNYFRSIANIWITITIMILSTTHAF